MLVLLTVYWLGILFLRVILRYATDLSIGGKVLRLSMVIYGDGLALYLLFTTATAMDLLPLCQ